MAEIQQFNLGQLLGQAEAIKGARRENQLADLLAPIQQQSAQLGLDQARLAQTQQLARTALGILGDTPEQNWTQAVEFAKQRGADLTGLEQYSPQAYEAVKQLATGGAGRRVQSTYVNDQGQRVAIYADGTTEVLGQAGTSKRIVDGVLVDVITGQASGIGGAGGLSEEEIRARQEAEAQRQADAAAKKKAAEERAALETQSELLPKVRAAIVDAETAAKQAGEITAEQRSNARAFSTYETGMKNLASALGATTTGPVAGWLPAITSNAQVAEGAAAVMAPILKSLFREAGEGTFTEGDQKLLMDMLPSRTDHPEAAKAKMKFIDDLVRQKLNAGQAQTTNPQAGMAGDQSGGAISAPATAPAAPASGNIDNILNRYR